MNERTHWAPKLRLMLDGDARILQVDRSLAGSAFGRISADGHPEFHRELHPECHGACTFADKWKKAWTQLQGRNSIEWEIDDPVLDARFRLNLHKNLAPSIPGTDRGRATFGLSISDLSNVRRRADESGPDNIAARADRLSDHDVRGILADEEERRRIVSDLHDGIAQSIGAAKVRLEAGMARLMSADPELDLSDLDGAVDELKHTLEEVRRTANNLAPPILVDFGLAAALDWLCANPANRATVRHIKCKTLVDEADVPNVIKIVVFRVAQQAMSNAIEHSSATTLELSLDATRGGVRLVVADNGTGFSLIQPDPDSDSAAHWGLRSMRERVETTGGHFEIDAQPGKGVCVRAEWTAEDLAVIGQLFRLQ